MHIITLLSLLTCLTATSSKDSNRNIIATVLFYANGKGVRLVASGPLPTSVEMQIKREITKKVPKAEVKVIPIFEHHADTPDPQDMFGYMRSTYKAIFLSDLPERIAYKIVTDEKYLKNKKVSLSELRQEVLSKMYPSNSVTKPENLSSSPIVNVTKVERKTTPKTSPGPKPLKLKAFYAIESKCERSQDKCFELPAEVYQLSTVSLSRFLRMRRKTSTTPLVPSRQ